MTTDIAHVPGQLAIDFPEAEEVKTAGWNATVCHRLVLADNRIVYVHYEWESYARASATWTIGRVSVHRPGGSQAEDYVIRDDPWSDRKPDLLPAWLHRLIQITPEPSPVAKD